MVGDAAMMYGDPYPQPDAAGTWAWEGYINYAKGADPNRIEHEVLRVYWGSVSQRWQVIGERGRHPANMLIGKWWRIYLPWDEA